MRPEWTKIPYVFGSSYPLSGFLYPILPELVEEVGICFLLLKHDPFTQKTIRGMILKNILLSEIDAHA